MIDLKNVLYRDSGRLDKLLIILRAANKPVSVAQIGLLATEAGFHGHKKWNCSEILSSSKGKAIRTPSGWELTDAGRAHVDALLGIQAPQPPPLVVDLREEMTKITNADTAAFVDEAVRCYEGKLYRSAIVMSWLAAVDVLYTFVLRHHLKAFNNAAAKVNNKWKPAVTADDLALMKERDFLDRLASISMIGKNVKTALVECLNRRNGCGHPNSLKIGPQTVGHHIETLILNVFQKFAV
jgi:hypothetical protein